MSNGTGLLLEKLYSMSRRYFLTDLKYVVPKADIMKLILRINPSDYSVAQWSYALSYLANRNIEITTLDELERFIQEAQEMPTW